MKEFTFFVAYVWKTSKPFIAEHIVNDTVTITAEYSDIKNSLHELLKKAITWKTDDVIILSVCQLQNAV